MVNIMIKKITKEIVYRVLFSFANQFGRNFMNQAISNKKKKSNDYYLLSSLSSNSTASLIFRASSNLAFIVGFLYVSLRIVSSWVSC